jgi:citrate synthase
MTSSNGAPYWTTDVSDVADQDVYIRGYRLGELIGRIPFSAATYLLVRGKLPTPGETRVIDALLCAILDYSLYKPGTVAARYAVSANPSMQVGMAVATMAVGEYTLAPDDAGRFIQDSYAEYQASELAMDDFAAEFIARYAARGRRVPGVGHPDFKYTDPRAQRLKQIAQEEGCWTEIGDWYEALHRAFTEHKNKPTLPINDVGMMAAIMSIMGFTPQEMTGLALISSLPGVIAHVSEELQTQTRIRIVPDEIAHYSRRRGDLDADLKAAGWS